MATSPTTASTRNGRRQSACAEQPADQGAGQRADALRQAPEAHHQAAAARRDQVADHGEADRGDRAQADRGEHLGEQERRVAAGERRYQPVPATQISVPTISTGLRFGAVARVRPADRRRPR